MTNFKLAIQHLKGAVKLATCFCSSLSSCHEVQCQAVHHLASPGFLMLSTQWLDLNHLDVCMLAILKGILKMPSMRRSAMLALPIQGHQGTHIVWVPLHHALHSCFGGACGTGSSVHGFYDLQTAVHATFGQVQAHKSFSYPRSHFCHVRSNIPTQDNGSEYSMGI